MVFVTDFSDQFPGKIIYLSLRLLWRLHAIAGTEKDGTGDRNNALSWLFSSDLILDASLSLCSVHDSFIQLQLPLST